MLRCVLKGVLAVRVEVLKSTSALALLLLPLSSPFPSSTSTASFISARRSLLFGSKKTILLLVARGWDNVGRRSDFLIFFSTLQMGGGTQ